MKKRKIIIIKKTNKDSEKEARERYQNLPEEEKDNRQKNARERYQNLTEEDKEKRRYKSLYEDKY